MPPKGRGNDANDADDNSQSPPNERRPGLRSRSKLKTTARNDDTVQPPSSPINRPAAAGSSAVPTNEIQQKINDKQKSLQNELQKIRKAAEDSGSRENQQTRLKATISYEDYLYYQTPEYRKQYREDIDAAVKDRAKLAFAKGHAPARLTDDKTYDRKLRSYLKDFENNGVGMLQNLHWQSMPPDQLRMRTPRAERFPVGLGEQLGGVPMEPYNLFLDTDAIEKKRKEVEDQNKDPKMSESHSERRARETGLSEGLPIDSHVNDALSTVKDLSRTRLESGLFISAGETWDDWKTLHEREAPDGLYDELVEEEMLDDDSDSSDDENDLFAVSYRECSGLAGCPRGGGGGDDDDGGSDDDGNSEKGEKKDTNDPGAPANPAGGPPTGSEPRPQSPRKKAKKHDYTQYNRPQVRTALKYREQAQSAQYVTELHKRANDYDDNPKQPGTIHHYILKDRSVANRLEKRITELGEGWSTEYKKELDEQNKNGEQVDTDVSEENSPVSTGKGKAKKTSKSKKKKKTQPKRKSKK
ncbi:uncharacterized protein J4E79_007256 [Alternaria viburni]|uniref:uncharacterized protein n=1 Tax=Alternaria viburni TaxID=566460 RepID=UPI0020C309BE|nr:uncharacterized protein J4E79_007256 [Alternaria viburni]KAI4658274.1 hypothetical protein J4E79_007256 [Alternaria viburni]